MSATPQPWAWLVPQKSPHVNTHDSKSCYAIIPTQTQAWHCLVFFFFLWSGTCRIFHGSKIFSTSQTQLQQITSCADWHLHVDFPVKGVTKLPGTLALLTHWSNWPGTNEEGPNQMKPKNSLLQEDNSKPNWDLPKISIISLILSLFFHGWREKFGTESKSLELLRWSITDSIQYRLNKQLAGNGGTTYKVYSLGSWTDWGKRSAGALVFWKDGKTSFKKTKQSQAVKVHAFNHST